MFQMLALWSFEIGRRKYPPDRLTGRDKGTIELPIRSISINATWNYLRLSGAMALRGPARLDRRRKGKRTYDRPAGVFALTADAAAVLTI